MPEAARNISISACDEQVHMILATLMAGDMYSDFER
jgi:hypothetical protein